MKVFVINTGSSSIKYKLFEMPSTEVLCSGLVDRIGKEDSFITYKHGSESTENRMPINDHYQGLLEVTKLLKATAVINDFSEIKAVGHRVVHGGAKFADTVLINNEVKEAIRSLFDLAPLHNPKNLTGIEVAEKIFPSVPHIAVFDTSFHQSMPEHTYRYAIPEKFYTEDQIRVYGFHGTSHKYVSEKAGEFLGYHGKFITAHLGNGCSISAVNAGKSLDTSMGFSPMNGLVMGTRAGDIDQSVIFYMMSVLGKSADEVRLILNHESGMLALSGFSDLRDIRKAMEQNDHKAILAYKIYTYRIKKYIGAYAAALGGLDALIFTGGVGENDPVTRAMSTEGLEFMGIRIDSGVNNSKMSEPVTVISNADSAIKVLVIKTDEELEIARQCYQKIE